MSDEPVNEAPQGAPLEEQPKQEVEAVVAPPADEPVMVDPGTPVVPEGPEVGAGDVKAPGVIHPPQPNEVEPENVTDAAVDQTGDRWAHLRGHLVQRFEELSEDGKTAIERAFGEAEKAVEGDKATE